jgi:hypothetical protein
VQVDGSAYMLDYLGVHLFSGNYGESMSTPIQDLFKTEPLGTYKINWKASRYFHAVVDPTEETIRWFICLNSHYLPHHALCFQYKLRQFWLEEFSMPIGARWAQARSMGRMHHKEQFVVHPPVPVGHGSRILPRYSPRRGWWAFLWSLLREPERVNAVQSRPCLARR